MFFITLSDAERRQHERMLREALDHAGLTIDQAAREAEIGHPQFIRQLQMIEGSLKRLAMQPKAFWQWWAVGLAAYYGLPREAKQAYRLHRQSAAYKRMARMALRDRAQERKSA